MAKASKSKLVETPAPVIDDDSHEAPEQGVMDSADDGDPIYHADDEHAGYERADDADSDFEEEESAKSEPGNPLDGQSLLRPEEVKYIKETGERMRRPLGFLKCTDPPACNWLVNEKDVNEEKVLALPDLLIIQRSLFVGGKGVQVKSDFAKDLKGAAPPRPPTFEDRSRWAEHHAKRKAFDPWGNISQVLPLQTTSGGILSFQANSAATKAAIGELIAAFVAKGAKQRPIVALSSDKNPETGERFPVFRIIRWAATNEDSSFIREMLIRNDPDFPEPKKGGDWSSLYGDK